MVNWSIGHQTRSFVFDKDFLFKTSLCNEYDVFCDIFCSCLQMISSNKEQTRFKAEIRRVRGVGRVGSWSWKSNIWRRKSQNDASWQVEFPLNVKIDKSIWQQMVRRISKSISRLFYPIIADWKGLVFQNIWQLVVLRWPGSNILYQMIASGEHQNTQLALFLSKIDQHKYQIHFLK